MQRIVTGSLCFASGCGDCSLLSKSTSNNKGRLENKNAWQAEAGMIAYRIQQPRLLHSFALSRHMFFQVRILFNPWSEIPGLSRGGWVGRSVVGRSVGASSFRDILLRAPKNLGPFP